MSHVFDINTTRRQQILVEYMTPAGSGFAITPQGEQVFMNKRLIDAMNVQEGDVYDAYLLPNYPDKREVIPWRAMRVEPTDVKLDLKHVTEDRLPNAIVDYIRDVEPDGIFDALDIAEALEIDQKHVEQVLADNPDMFEPCQAYTLNVNLR